MQPIFLILFGIAVFTSAASMPKPRQTAMIGDAGLVYQQRRLPPKMGRDSLRNRNGRYGYYTTPYYNYYNGPYLEEVYPEEYYDFGRPPYYGDIYDTYGYDTYPFGYYGGIAKIID